ncbi:uncharacterized protein LOC131666131 [Phymastichus coffea]|uniref:uncharacterized protein LOC131666131 n=1 Tax=Phymastichus coffea TaxID=108790 RepID=UPI00273ADDC4|nr:uncharacterized protein LOC131666131 [Phymastichus coffea]
MHRILRGALDTIERCKEKILKGRRMKYSPQAQQQQQKDRKSESEMSSVNATPARAAAGVLQRSASAASAAASQTTSAARRVISCRPLSTDMFAWMRVFRLAHMLQSVNC